MSYGGQPIERKVLGSGLSSLHHTTQRLLRFKKDEFYDEDRFRGILDKSLSDPEDKSFRLDVTRAYNSLYKHHGDFTDEENLINRMERKSQIRNTFFRAFTTLSIGFSIMFVYWVAAKCGIPMPLMRIPL